VRSLICKLVSAPEEASPILVKERVFRRRLPILLGFPARYGDLIAYILREAKCILILTLKEEAKKPLY
jgi:hypothetical protein